jgi:hypothetical protein
MIMFSGKSNNYPHSSKRIDFANFSSEFLKKMREDDKRYPSPLAESVNCMVVLGQKASESKS